MMCSLGLRLGSEFTDPELCCNAGWQMTPRRKVRPMDVESFKAPRKSHHQLLLRQSTYSKMGNNGNWDNSWIAWSFSPSISAILATFLISIILPILFHYFLYRKSAPKQLPTILLLGPSGGGKTTLLTSVSIISIYRVKHP
jgi:hypothetical protein